jgi:hypothetical protein
MIIKRVALFVAIIIILVAAYSYGLSFSEDPNTNWFFAVTAAALVYCVKLLYDDYNADVLSERQYSEKFKNAVSSLSE